MWCLVNRPAVTSATLLVTVQAAADGGALSGW
jgi:hypothetical protein